MSDIGERLRDERVRLGLTQIEIAEKLEVASKTQGLYERNARNPTTEYLQGAAKLGMDVNYIITGLRVGEPANKLNAQEQALVSLYRNAKQETQAAVMGILATGVVPG